MARKPSSTNNQTCLPRLRLWGAETRSDGWSTTEMSHDPFQRHDITVPQVLSLIWVKSRI